MQECFAISVFFKKKKKSVHFSPKIDIHVQLRKTKKDYLIKPPSSSLQPWKQLLIHIKWFL